MEYVFNCFSVTICNVNQVSKAFLDSINITNDDDAKILFEEFIDGNVQLWEEYERTKVDNPIFRENLAKVNNSLNMLRDKYGWDKKQSFVKVANQESRLRQKLLTFF